MLSSLCIDGDAGNFLQIGRQATVTKGRLLFEFQRSTQQIRAVLTACAADELLAICVDERCATGDVVGLDLQALHALDHRHVVVLLCRFH